MSDLVTAAKKRHAEDDAQKADSSSRKSKKKRSSRTSRHGWTMSHGAGGSIIPLSPVFSDDGEAIAIAYPSSIKVFSTRNSLLMRSFEVGKGKITGLTRSARNHHEIFVSTDQGRLNKWNWSEDLRANVYDLGRRIRSLASAGNFPDDTADVLYTIEDAESSGQNSSGGSTKYVNCITLHALSRVGLANQRRTVYRSKVALNSLRVIQGGECIVASAGSQLILGVLSETKSLSDIDQMIYTWYHLDTPGHISCLDVYSRPQKSSLDADIAIGTSSGPIHLYSNIISTLRKIAKKKENANPSVQRLHWHRYAVGTVKFSKDGSYLISGGIETVLCSWQLDTGKRQDLPHLTAPIESLVISPEGASYAVTLGNNSVIILSTIDFKPTFAVTGPAWPVDTNPKMNLGAFPATVRPNTIPTQLLLATPSSIHGDPETGPLSAVYLQTIDIRTGLQLSKQALTRNNATDRITSPQGHLIAEPNVSLMAVSQDGQWLATVERWEPSTHDQHPTTDPPSFDASSLSRPEIFLKFWNFDGAANLWELSSRVDEPHAENPYDTYDVLDLCAIPSGFITVGMDGHVRMWKQQYRQRNNLQVKDKEGRRLVNWYCASVLPGPPSPIVDDLASPISSARLAASADGSLAALILQYRHTTTVCLIDVLEQNIVSTRNDLPLQCLHDVAILDRYLIILSDHLLVWDLIRDMMHFSYAYGKDSSSAGSQSKLSHLATHPDGSFAVAVPTTPGYSSRIAVFDPRSSDPLTVHPLNEPIRGIFPQTSPQGFVVLTGRSQIYQLTSPNVLTDDFEEEVLAGSDQVTSPLLGKDLPIRRLPSAGAEPGDPEYDGSKQMLASQEESIVTQSKLAELFDSSNPAKKAHIVDMFERVAELTIGRPGQTTA